MRKVLLLAVIALVSACGSAAESVNENLLERQIEQETGGDVSVDLGNDGNASINIRTDEGSQSISMGDDADIPEGFPIPVPSGGNVVYSATDTGTATAVVLVDYPAGRYEELVATYDDYFDEGDAQRIELSDPPTTVWSSADGTESVTVTRVDDTTAQAALSWTG